MKETSNLQPHYNITVEENLTYTFHTLGGIKYTAYFLCCDSYHPGLINTFMFNFDHEETVRKRIYESKVKATIIHILNLFFETNTNSMIYICDSLDGREKYRKRLFDLWFKEYYSKENTPILREDIKSKNEYYELFASLLIHEKNPNLPDVVEAFHSLKDMLV